MEERLHVIDEVRGKSLLTVPAKSSIRRGGEKKENIKSGGGREFLQRDIYVSARGVFGEKIIGRTRFP